MSSPNLAPAAAPAAAPNPNGGPRTPEGRAVSSRNALTFGLYAARDFVRPGEESAYRELSEALRSDLAPVGILEDSLVDEIRRAIWRLNRCAEIEAGFAARLAPGPAAPAADPMENDAHAQLQSSVDRARSQAHRLLHKCTAELRKLQTERMLRNESFEAGADLSDFGLCDWAAVRRALSADYAARQRRADLCFGHEAGLWPHPADLAVVPPGSFCKSAPAAPETPRNAPCPCGSGRKFKRCCGAGAAPVLCAA